MPKSNRRSWLKTFTTAGTGAMLLSPTEILQAMPSHVDRRSTKDKLIRLSSNENPYSPSPRMSKVLSEIDPDICRYPNMHFSTLEAQIAEREGIPTEHVVITSGSREGLKAVGLMYGINNGEILTCLPTYKALLDYAQYFGANIRAVPLDEGLGYNLPGLSDNITDETKLIFVCNPNNPTGTLLDPFALERFCRAHSSKAPIFIDEVYYDYIEEEGYPSTKHLIIEGHDIIIARTFSKIYGLAGARIGYMMASIETASKIRESLMSGTNMFGLRLAQASLDDTEFYKYSLHKNKVAKEMIYESLTSLGLKYIPSHANFVFFHTDRDIAEVQRDFTDLGVTVGRAFPPYMDWCRISTGKIEEVEIFVKALRQIFT